MITLYAYSYITGIHIHQKPCVNVHIFINMDSIVYCKKSLYSLITMSINYPRLMYSVDHANIRDGVWIPNETCIVQDGSNTCCLVTDAGHLQRFRRMNQRALFALAVMLLIGALEVIVLIFLIKTIKQCMYTPRYLKYLRCSEAFSFNGIAVVF